MEDLSLLKNFVLSLHTSLKLFQLYSSSHPSFLDSVEKIQSRLRELFESEDIIALSVNKNQITYQSAVVGESNEIIADFSAILYHAGIKEITFQKGIIQQEIIDFLNILNMNNDLIKSLGGVGFLLQEKNCVSLKVRQADELRLRKAGPCDDIFASFDSGIARILDNEPSQVAQLLVSSSSKDAAQESEGEAEAYTAEFITMAYEKAFEYIDREVDEKDREKLSETIAQSINFLPHEIKNRVLNEQIFSCTGHNKFSSVLVNYLCESTIISLLNNKFDKQTFSEQHFSELLGNFSFTDVAKKEKIINTLNEQYSTEEIESDVSLFPASDMEELKGTSQETLKELVSELNTYTDNELETIERISVSGGEADTITASVNVLRELMFMDTDIDNYTGFVRILQEFLEVLFASSDFVSIGRIFEVLQEQLKREDFDFPEYKLIIRRIISESGTRERIQDTIDALRGFDRFSEEFAALHDYLISLGHENVPVLVEILAEEQDISIRRLLCEALAEVGKLNIGLLVRNLKDKRWYLVRNIVKILGMIGDVQNIAFLEKVLNHPDGRVRSEVVRAMGILGGEIAVKYIKSKLHDRNINLQIQAVQWLGNIGSKSAISALIKVTRRFDFFGKYTILKKEAIMSLGMIGSPDAVQVLRQCLKKRWYSRTKKYELIQNAALKALKKIRIKSKGNV